MGILSSRIASFVLKTSHASRIVKLTRGSRYELPAIDTVEPLTLTTGKMALRGKVMVFQSLYIS